MLKLGWRLNVGQFILNSMKHISSETSWHEACPDMQCSWCLWAGLQCCSKRTAAPRLSAGDAHKSKGVHVCHEVAPQTLQSCKHAETQEMAGRLASRELCLYCMSIEHTSE